MIKRGVQLFRRYARTHEDIHAPGFALSGAQGEALGQVEDIQLARGQIRITGWCRPRKLDLVVGGMSHFGQPSQTRGDVAETFGLDGTVPYGFVVEAPYEDGPCHLVLNAATQQHVYTVPLPDAATRKRARREVKRAFVRDVWRALPMLLRWLVTREESLRAPIKRALRFETPGDWAVTFDAAVLPADTSGETPCAEPQSDSDLTPITIVLPVFNAYDLLAEVLARVEAHTDLPWHLILIEDCSSDARVRPFLRGWAAGRTDRVTLIENETNTGFIHSVNAGLDMAAARAGHVALLNSDAFVPAGWASRLLAPILADESVASVTPMSNDAEIFTAPVICARHGLKPGEADAIDAVAATLDAAHARADAPTGVGFCMAMNRRFLQQLPALDTVFGRGYGEEVDWCRRAAAIGGHHVGIATLFVEHRGGTSFGSEAKQAMVRKNNAIISERYPGYDVMVQEFIRTDPLASARLMLALAWAQARQDGPVPIYLGHTMGGGAETYLQDRIAQDIAAGGSAVTLRVGGILRWQIGVHCAHGTLEVLTNDDAVLERIFAPLTQRRIVYSNGVGHFDPIALPGLLMDLERGPGDSIEVLLHDFLPLSPTYTLLNAGGHFDGVPPADSTDYAHQVLRPDGSRSSLAAWRMAWGALLARAETVVAFSDNSRALLLEAYPELEARCVVRPHAPDLSEIARVRPPAADAPPVIGVLGNIGYQKGAALLQDLSTHLGRRPSGADPVGLVVIGNIDPAFTIQPPARVHGSYRVTDVPSLAARYGITCWLIPSIWPETFSYTTHEALATGLPVWSFDLGAQGDTVAAAAARSGQGGVLPLDLAGPGGDSLERLLRVLSARSRAGGKGPSRRSAESGGSG